jgi:hypothetical protein
MVFDQAIVLENECVRLQPLQKKDYLLFTPFLESTAEIWKYSLSQIRSLSDLENYFAKAAENRRQQKEYPFVVFDKLKNQYAGCTRFYDIQLEYKYLQLGYTWYGLHFQGTYVNKNCKFLVL